MARDYKVEYKSRLIKNCWMSLKSTFKTKEDAQQFAEQYKAKHPKETLRIVIREWIDEHTVKEMEA